MNSEVREDFYTQVNELISRNNYTILASAINKKEYIKKYGKLSDDIYELALSFIIERAVFFLDDKQHQQKQLNIVIEKRGAKEDKKLHEHFQKLLARGTNYITPERLKLIDVKIEFRSKKDNINGLQLADLIAYPLARFVMHTNRANPAYDLFSNKIYSKNGKQYGLKYFP
jgi:Protein of unknown function (DUF3800)